MKEERKHPSQLTISDASLRIILDASPVGMIVFDHEARVIYANTLAEQIFDQSVNRDAPRKCGDFIACPHRHSDAQGCGHTDRCASCPLFRAIRAVGEKEPDEAGLEGEVMLLREPEKPDLWVKFKVKRFLMGERKTAVMAIDDITHRKMAEEALRESEKKYRKIFENAPVGIFQTTSQGRFLSANPEYARMAGYAGPSEMIEQVSDIAAQLYVRPEDRKRYTEVLQRHGEVKNFEAELKRPDGSTFWVSMNAKAIENQDGSFVYDGFLSEITERVRAEQALRNTEALQRKMVSNIGDVIVIIDQEGINRYKSPNIEKWFGWKPQEVMGVNALENVHPEDKHSAQHFLESLLNEPNRTSTAQCRYRCKDGSYKWIEFTGINLLHDPDVHGILGNYHDITARRRADNELRRQIKFIQTVLDNLPIGLAVNYLKEGTVAYINHAFEKIYGWPKEELQDVRSFFEKVYPDPQRREKFQARFQNDVASGDLERMHWDNIQVTAQDGSRRIVTAKNIPLVEQNIMISTVQDITRQRHAEQELLKERQRLAHIIEGTNVGTWEWNVQTGETIVNERWATMIGYTLEELAPVSIETWKRLAHPDDLKKSEALLAKHFAGETGNYECECRMQHKDGSWVWVFDRGRVSQWRSDGRPLLMAGTHYDISRRKKTEAALRESEERFYKAFMYNPAPLVISDIKTGQFIDVNDRWIQMLGFSKEEQIGRTSKQVGIWDNPDERDRLVKQLEENGFFKDEQIVFRKKTGEEIHARWSAESVLLAGRQVMLSMIFDETDRIKSEKENKKLQSQLIQAQKMESVGRLAGGVAHDFNNMLSVIMGNAELAIKNLAANDPLHENLGEIFSAARRSADITSQLLAFARKQTIAPKVVDLNAIVESMLRMLRRLIGENIDLAWMPGKQLWSVKIDPAQIDQILVNLCVNARDAIGGVGKVTIETGNTTFDDAYCEVHAGFLPGQYLMLAVSDDGCGMDKEIMQHIFEPFFTTKGVAEGTGLGLPTVYGIVKQNEGFINVYSELGKGTTFRIYLPRHVGEAPRMIAATKTKTPMGKGETVLLVEDEPSIMHIVQTMLDRIGYQVLSAGTPMEALALATQHAGAIDLLVTDVVMPEMSGRNLEHQIHALYPGIKTLFMSGYTANVIAHNGVLDEGVNFIQKPFSLHDLGLKVRLVLDEK